MRLQDQARPQPAENVVPLINLVFLLLMFFLLAGSLSARPPVELEPVEAEAGAPAHAPLDALYVSALGRLYWQGAAVELSELAAVVARAGVVRSGEPLEVVLDRRLAADRLFPIVEALAGSGVDAVRLVTLRSDGQ